MTDKEALDLIYEAADRWGQELAEYIIPGASSEEDRASYQHQLDQLSLALERVAASWSR